jgi:hypothetical protein
MRGHSLFPLSLPPPPVVVQIIKQRSSPSTKTFDGPVVTRRSPTGAAAQPLLAHLSSYGTGPRPGPGHTWSVYAFFTVILCLAIQFFTPAIQKYMSILPFLHFARNDNFYLSFSLNSLF